MFVLQHVCLLVVLHYRRNTRRADDAVLLPFLRLSDELLDSGKTNERFVVLHDNRLWFGLLLLTRAAYNLTVESHEHQIRTTDGTRRQQWCAIIDA